MGLSNGSYRRDADFERMTIVGGIDASDNAPVVGKRPDEILVRLEDVSFSYESSDDERIDAERQKAVSGVSIDIRRGEFVVLLGRNGSGKSTIARLMNALLLPTSGNVYVKGISSKDADNIWEIRRSVGMVFQNPDNQIVGTTVEEDVAFGVENLGTPPIEIRERIDRAMKRTNVSSLADRPPYQLSGGQKQRVAIAGILAMRPECIILDEATSMLDPEGREEVLGLVSELNRDRGIAVVLITHHMEEALLADRVILIENGTVAMELSPRELFKDTEGVRRAGLSIPQVTRMFEILKDEGYNLPDGVTDADEACDALQECKRTRMNKPFKMESK